MFKKSETEGRKAFTEKEVRQSLHRKYRNGMLIYKSKTLDVSCLPTCADPCFNSVPAWRKANEWLVEETSQQEEYHQLQTVVW